jgi:polyhydroxyalkanoate synthesis regulator phasin
MSDSDFDNSSTEEQFFSPSESLRNPTQSAHNASNVTVKSNKRPLHTSQSSESPSPTVQKSVKKIIKLSDDQIETPKMDESTKDFLKELMKSCEENTALLIQQSEERTAKVIKNEIAAIASEVTNKFQTQISNLQGEVHKISQEIRKKTVWIHGLPESPNEKWQELDAAIETLRKKMGLLEKIDYDDAFRVGKPRNGHTRAVVLKLMRLQDKKLMMSKKGSLKGTNIFINNDINKEDRIKESILRKVSKSLLKDNPGSSTQLRRGQLQHKIGSTIEVYVVNENGEVIKNHGGRQPHQMDI